MAEYNLFINAEIDEANKKLDKVDKKLESIDKKAGSLDLQFPNLDQAAAGLQAVGKGLQFVWEYSDTALGSINRHVGAVGDLKEAFSYLLPELGNFAKQLQNINKLMPTTIVGTGFEALSTTVNNSAQSVARLGYVFFGLQQSIGLVQQTFNGFFNSTIRRQAELEATILQTKTTLASTARVLVDGLQINDPLAAIEALDKPIEETITNIRRRSLEIAGTTSQAIIQTFSVVSAQIGQIGGDLKDAEDLSISFAAALGTIGLSNPMYATQEIRSILTGNIDQNSVLARSLGITNEDVTKAKASAEGLVSWLEGRLAAFGAGQKIAATQLSGVLSNVLEVYEEFTREIGKPVLAPLLDAITAIFDKLSGVFKQLLGFASALGTAFGEVARLAQNIIGSSSFNLISQEDIAKGLEEAGVLVIEFVESIMDKVYDYIRPMAVRILNDIKSLIDTLLPSVGRLVAAFAEFQIIKFEVVIDSFEYLVSIVKAIAPALKGVLDLYAGLMASDWIQFLSQTVLYIEILEKSGINAIARLVVQLAGSAAVYKKWWAGLKAILSSIKPTILNIRNFIIGVIKGLEANVIAFITGIIEVFANTGAIITQTVRTVALKIKAVLLEIAVLAQGTGTAIGSSIATAALAAATAMDTLATKSGAATTALMKVDANANNIAKNINPIGKLTAGVGQLATAVKVKLASAFKIAGAAIKSAAIGLALFAAQMIAITVVMGLALQLWSKYSNGVQRTATINKGIRANERLKTSLAGVNEESSLWMRRQKEMAQAARRSSIEKINEQLDEQAKRAKKAAERLKELENTTPMFQNAKNSFARKTARERENLKAALEEASKLRRRQEELTKEETAEAQKKADKETVQILGKERTAIEALLKKEREKIERSLADYKFRIEQGNQQKLQQGREAQFRVELARIQQAQEQAKTGLTGVALQVANILDDYTNSLLTAEQERLKREFDLKQQVAKLAKDTADYGYKLEEQKAKLQKKAGDFNVKVANYQAEVNRRKNEEDMETALKVGKLRTKGYTMFDDTTDNFKNVASANDISSTKLLALLQAGFAEDYGISSDIPIQEVIDIVKRNFDVSESLKAGSGDADFMKILEGYTQNKALADFAFAGAKAELGTNGLYKKAMPAPPKIEDLSFDLDGFKAERKRLNNQLLDATRALNDTLSKVNSDLANLKLEQLRTRPDLLTSGLNIMSPEASEEGIANAQLRARAFRQGGSNPNPFDYDNQKQMLQLNKEAATKVVPGNVGLDSNKRQLALDGIETNYQNALKKLPQGLADAQKKATADAIAQLTGDIEGLKSSGIENLRATATEAAKAVASLGDNAERQIQQVEIEAAVQAMRNDLVKQGIPINAEINELLTEYQGVLEATSNRQQELNDSLEPLLQRVGLVKLAAETFTGALRNAAGGLLNGQDPGAILDTFANTLTGAVTDGLFNYAFDGLNEQFETLFGEAFNLQDTEEQIKTLTGEFKDNTKRQLDDIKAALDRIKDVPAGMGGGYDSEYGRSDSHPEIGNFVGGDDMQPRGTAIPIAVEPFESTTNTLTPAMETLSSTMGSAGEAAEALTFDMSMQAGEFVDLGESLEGVGETAKSAQSAIGAATTVLAGIGMVANGITKLQEGGTQNFLAGLGQIFMGVGSAGLGISSFFADGGRPAPNKLAVIGEDGPELWVPDSAGTIISNKDAFGAARGAMSGAASGNSNKEEGASTSAATTAFAQNTNSIVTANNLIRERETRREETASFNSAIEKTKEATIGGGGSMIIETQVINNVEYASIDQVQKASALAIKQARAQVFSDMKNRPSIRRQIGVG